ncbi:MAG: hypothetical protein LPH21_19325 [Shewanella sp.]|nr:hypothetical protein [Shewanella sp.]
MEDGTPYGSALVAEGAVDTLVTADRIVCGEQLPKFQLDTKDNNALAQSLASSGLIPGVIECDVQTAVSAGKATLKIIAFNRAKAS